MNLQTAHLVIVFALVVGVFIAFVREWLSPDVVALIALGALLFTGILSSDETMKVFSNSAPITIGCMFVLSAALERTGALDAVARVFLRLAGASELRALVVLAVFTQRLETPLDKLRFAAGDLLLLETPVAGVKGIKEMPGVVFQPEAELGDETSGAREAVLMEGIIGSRSTFVGKTLRELNFRQRYGVLILAVHRQGENLRENFEDVRLAFGDTLLVQGPAQGIQRLMQERDFLNLTEPKQRAFRPHLAPLATGTITVVMLVAAFDILPIAALALIAAIFVVVAGCLDIEEAYEAIEWKLLFIIFGMLALGSARRRRGAAHLLASGVTGAVGRFGPFATLSVMYLVAMILTELISNNAVAVLLTPLAFEIAATMGVDARPFAVAVMFGCSASFATPIGYQTNTYVFGARWLPLHGFPEGGCAAQSDPLGYGQSAHSSLLAVHREALGPALPRRLQIRRAKLFP